MREPEKAPAMSTSLKREMSRCWLFCTVLLVAGMVYAPVSGACAVKPRVLMVADLAVLGVVQLTSRAVLAGTVALAMGAFQVCAPGLPTTTPCTLPFALTTLRVKGLVPTESFELVYRPEPAVASTSGTSPS